MSAIEFNGRTLESVAPVKIVDIMISPLQMTPVTRQRPVRAGADFVRMQHGARTVAINFALLTNDLTIRQRQLMEINKWALSETEAPLVLPNYPGKTLSCVCTALPEPSTRQWWESKLRIVFTAYNNPYWTSIEEKAVNCGTAFFAGGDVPPLMRITRTLSSSASNQTYSDGPHSMTFTAIPAGNMVIDLNRQTAEVGGTSIMSAYTFGSQFPEPKTGWQTITGSGKVRYRERWY